MTQEERDEMRRKTKLMFGRSWGALTLMMALVALVTLLGAGTALAANHWTDITDQQWVNDYGVTAAQPKWSRSRPATPTAPSNPD